MSDPFTTIMRATGVASRSGTAAAASAGPDAGADSAAAADVAAAAGAGAFVRSLTFINATVATTNVAVTPAAATAASHFRRFPAACCGTPSTGGSSVTAGAGSGNRIEALLAYRRATRAASSFKRADSSTSPCQLPATSRYGGDVGSIS